MENNDLPVYPRTAPGLGLPAQTLQEFFVEVQEHAENLDAALVALDKKRDDRETLNELFRAVHSIKGAAGYVSFADIEKLAHSMESILEVVRRMEHFSLTDGLLDVFFEALRGLHALVDCHQSENTPPDVSGILKHLEDELRQIGAEPSEDRRGVSADPYAIFRDSATQHLEAIHVCLNKAAGDEGAGPEMSAALFRAIHSLKSAAKYMGFAEIEQTVVRIEELLTSVHAGRQRFECATLAVFNSELSEIEAFVETLSKPPPAHALPAEPPSTDAAGETPKLADGTVRTMRVDQRLLDVFMNLVGELIVTRNTFGHIQKRLENSPEQIQSGLRDLTQATQAVTRISEEMHRYIMEMRMVPVRNLFQKFPRMVRDISRQKGKTVELVMQGEETEIDKGIAEQLTDPLVHLVRNAVDHGIESPERRRQAGKTEKGLILLRASHEGNFVVIEIVDDGAGIDPKKIAAKALNDGLTTPDAVARMSKDEILEFIYLPGFSTAEQVTGISGRGVGMDVARTNIRRINGHIRLTSEVGKGSQIRLEVPLTMAVIESLLVSVKHNTYAVPIHAIAETVKVKGRALKPLAQKRAMTLRGELIGVEPLARLLGLDHDGEVHAPDQDVPILILQAGRHRLGVIVDQLYRQEEIVVKPLANYLAALPGLAGASILGDGRAILILDPPQLVGLALRARAGEKHVCN